MRSEVEEVGLPWSMPIELGECLYVKMRQRPRSVLSSRDE